jgi:hypothetical protein
MRNGFYSLLLVKNYYYFQSNSTHKITYKDSDKGKPCRIFIDFPFSLNFNYPIHSHFLKVNNHFQTSLTYNAPCANSFISIFSKCFLVLDFTRVLIIARPTLVVDVMFFDFFNKGKNGLKTT